MIKKIFAAFLSFLITALSAGPQCASVFAQQAAARTSRPAIPVPAIVRPFSPAGFGISPVKIHSPSAGVRASIFGINPGPADVPKPAQSSEVKTPFQETLANLEAPSLVEGVSPEATSAEVRAAGRDDFSTRLGEGASPAQDGVSVSQTESRRRDVLAPAARSEAATLEELRQVLGDGVLTEHGFTRPFGFKNEAGQWTTARSAGLEGFLYTKLELERSSPAAAPGRTDDYFNYLDGLLAPMSWAQPLRKDLAAMRASKIEEQEKNRRLNEKLVSMVSDLQGQVRARDGALWVREANIYMIFARAYNRLRPGKNFLDSIDEEEFSRIKTVSGSNVIWLQDIFDIGKINRWGTGGGSSYAISGYRVKEALGGDEALKRLIERAGRSGFRICVDFIPNHGAIDGDLVRAHPDGAIHIVPPPEIQKLSNEEILAAVPQQKGTPVFYLVEVDNYPENGRLVHKKVLIHHPLTDEGDMWIDMAQYDFSRPQTRAWGLAQSRRLLEKFGIKLFRLDMSNEVVNERYFPRWREILSKERDRSQGWVREEMSRFIEGFEKRRQALGGEEFLTQMSAEDRRAAPDAGKISEAYTNFEALSRTGTNGIYNKVELYDALVSRDPARIRAAQKNAAFKEWQLGAAAAVNFVGTHDGGEGNPVDKFGREFKAAVLTALSSLPILFYNGLELGVGQKEMLAGDLSKSVDTSKAIPMDIPVSIQWEALNADNQDYLKMVLARTQRKVTNVMDPKQESPISAWSEKSAVDGGAPTILIKAANFSQHRGSGVFDMKSPVLGPFGAFEPRADRNYVLRDFANPVNGQPAVYERSGRDLLDHGLYIALDAGGTHLFEVEEVNPNAPAAGPPAKASQVAAASANNSWDVWTQRLTDSASVFFIISQLMQITKNTANLAGKFPAIKSVLEFWNGLGLPYWAPGSPKDISILAWSGYSTGILANMLMLSYFASIKEKSGARVQASSVIMSSLVLCQLTLAGAMPLAAFVIILPLVVWGLALNYLNFKDKVSPRAWKFFSAVGRLLGFVAVPQFFWSTFAPAAMASFWPAGIAAAAGLSIMELDRRSLLPERIKKVWEQIEAKTATFLFACGPAAQQRNNFLRPNEMGGISVLGLMLSMVGVLAMMPRAMQVGMKTGDYWWFGGCAWGAILGGWVVLLQMYLHGGILSSAATGLFFSSSAFIPLYLAFAWSKNRR